MTKGEWGGLLSTLSLCKRLLIKHEIIWKLLSQISVRLYVPLSLLLSDDKNNHNVSYGTSSRRDSLTSDMDRESQQNKSSHKSNSFTLIKY